jgi:polysaccharide biosynthesis protein PslG
MLNKGMTMTVSRYALLLMLLLALAACGGQQADEAPVESLPEVTDAPPEPTFTLPPPVIITEGEESAPEALPESAEPEALPSGPIEPWPADAFGYGVQSHAVVGDPAFAMDVIRNQLSFDWVKIQLEWAVVHPDPDAGQWFFYDGPIADANRQGLRVMLSVVGAPAWTRAAGGENGPPDDFDLYVQFLTELLNRYPGQIHAIEVWNEQNLDREWTSAQGIDPAGYIDFLSRAYAAIKAYDENIIVISGALAPTGVSDGVTALDDFIWMDQALAAGLLQYADCVGVHHNGYNIPPDVPFDQAPSLPEAATAIFRGPFDNPHHSWSFRTTLDTYAQKVQAVNPGMMLCVTEFGWPSSEGYDSYPPGFEFAQDNTLEEQAQYIVQAFRQMYDSSYVWLTFLFNYDFGNKGGGPTDDPVVYSIIDIVGAPRPAFAAVAEMEKPR